MSVSTGVKAANYACGTLAYVWFALCWFLALIPGYLDRWQVRKGL